MSLQALNQPPLVAVSGLAAMAALPALERAIASGGIPLPVVKALNGLLYGLNVFATSQPGRIDGQMQREAELARKKKDDGDSGKQAEQEDDEEEDTAYSTGMRRRSLVVPKGWAFIIWAPIFLGELVFVTSSALMLKDDASSSPGGVASVFKKASAGFMVSQVMQSLWAAAFRPKYQGSAAYISAGLLSGIAYCLNRAHGAYTSSDLRAAYGTSDYLLYFLPMTVHFGWTTAASLVNLNGSIAASGDASSNVLAALGHLSAISATAMGVLVTVTRQAPVYGGVIAWALTACAGGMESRIESTNTDEDKYGANVQMWLCRIGAVISAAAAGFVVVTSRRDSSKHSN